MELMHTGLYVAPMRDVVVKTHLVVGVLLYDAIGASVEVKLMSLCENTLFINITQYPSLIVVFYESRFFRPESYKRL